MWGNEPSHSQVNSHLESWNPQMGSWIFKEPLQGTKLNGLKHSLYHWKALGTKMSKMSLHDPFEHLKHKLWPKEGSGVKLAIWLPTTKSQELPRFPRAQVACNRPLEISQQGLQFCFRLHCNQRSTRKVMGPQSCESPSCGNSETHTWESRDKMPFQCGPRGKAQSIL
jgi:hypothetical protein